MTGKDKQYYIDKYGAEAQAAWEKSDKKARSTGGSLADWAKELARKEAETGMKASTFSTRSTETRSADPYAGYKGI